MEWIDPPSPSGGAFHEEVVTIQTAPILPEETGTYVYVGGNLRLGNESAFLVTQTRDVGVGPNSSPKWRAVWNRRLEVGGQNVDTLTTLATARELGQVNPNIAGNPLVLASGTSLNSAGKLNLLSAKFSPDAVALPAVKTPEWSMNNPAPDGLTNLIPFASWAQSGGGSGQPYMEVTLAGRMSQQCNGSNAATCGDSFILTKYYQHLE